MEFLVRYFAQPKKREEDLEIMGYPFNVEVKKMWGNKVLLACIPFTMGIKCAKEAAVRYGTSSLR